MAGRPLLDRSEYLPISSDSSQTFDNLEKYLLGDSVAVIYFFDNCAADPNQPIEVLGNAFGAILNLIQDDIFARIRVIRYFVAVRS